jgi:hypothetical protein
MGLSPLVEIQEAKPLGGVRGETSALPHERAAVHIDDRA